MTKKRVAARYLMASVLVVGMLSTTSGFGEWRRYTGSFCMFSDDDLDAKDRWPPKFQNRSGGTRKVVCPLVNNGAAFPGLNYIEAAGIVVTDTVDEDTCRLGGRRPDGSWSYFVHTDVVSAGGHFSEVRWFPGSSVGVFYADAALALSCDLEANKSVLGYYMDE
jgi:hypothetical protein